MVSLSSTVATENGSFPPAKKQEAFIFPVFSLLSCLDSRVKIVSF